MFLKNLLNTFFKKNDIKTLFLVDILYMKDLNAIYGFKNGDYIISQLNQILKNKTLNLIKKELKRNIDIKIKNGHADVFEILLYDNLTIEEILLIKNLIYENMVANNFNLLNNSATINIDAIIGCAKSNDDYLKVYAEKAL